MCIREEVVKAVLMFCWTWDFEFPIQTADSTSQGCNSVKGILIAIVDLGREATCMCVCVCDHAYIHVGWVGWGMTS